MYRYISLVWNATDTQATETAKFLRGYFDESATPWEVAYKGDGLLALHTGQEKNRMQAYPLRTEDGHSGGVVLGKLFKRERNPEAVAKNADLNTEEARAVIHSAGRHLVDDYWGSYVAFFQDDRRKYILLDPMGVFPCFSTCYRGVEIYFTHLPDVASCKLLTFSVDWTLIAQKISYSYDRTDVPIHEVNKILPGQRLTVTPTGVTKIFCWNPQKISQTNVIEDMEEAARALRQTILSTVAALAEPYARVMQSIGGLDSSILLASLKQVPTSPDVTCINQYSNTPAGDERYFVRKTAAHMGVPLIEYKLPRPELDFKALSKAAVTTTPPYYLMFIKDREILFDNLHKTKSQVMFNGYGGDEILYVHGQNYAPVDYIRMYGIRPPLFRLIMEAARMQKKSIWAILPEVIRSGYRKARVKEVNAWSEDNSFLTSDIQGAVQATAEKHPWTENSDNIPPGKFHHISPLATGRFDREVFTTPDQYYPTVYPFLSQSVVELCLRIPIWLMLAHGKGRGLARKAFKNDLPAEVIWRESKSAAESHTKSLILGNLDIVKALLLDGEMVRGNLLDRQHVEHILNNPSGMTDSDFSYVFLFLNIEIWARKLNGEAFTEFIRSKVA